MSVVNHHVRRFKSLETALKELQRFVRNGHHLQTGKPFAQFGDMRSREMLANSLLCVVANATWENAKLTFCSDPTAGDGIIWDEASGETWPTEHVNVNTAVAIRAGAPRYGVDADTKVVPMTQKKRR
jgi:hypothetical protein